MRKSIWLVLVVLLAMVLLLPSMAFAQDGEGDEPGDETGQPGADTTLEGDELVAAAVALDEDFALQPLGPFAYLQLAHFSFDGPAVEVWVDGEASDIQALAFGGVTGWVELEPGVYQIALVPVGGELADAVVGPIAYTLNPGVWTTFAAVGSAEAGTFTVQLLRPDYSALDANTARVGFFHAVLGAPSVDLVLDDETLLAENVPYVATRTAFNAGFAQFEVDAGTYTINVVPTGETEPVLAVLDGVEFEPQTFYFVAAFGTVDDPIVQIESISMLDLSELTNVAFEDLFATDAETEMDAELDATDSELGDVGTEEEVEETTSG